MQRIERHGVGIPTSGLCGLGPSIPRAAEGSGPFGNSGPALRVVIVEDDYFIALQNQAALENLGHEVVGVAATFADAVHLAELERPDLFVMDIRLSGAGDGIDAANEIVNRFGIRSLFVSAYTDDSTRSRAEPARPLGWLTKPFTIEQFSASLHAAIQRLHRPES